MPHDFVAPGAHWKLEGDKYIQYKYGPGQLAKEWRDLTKMQRTTDAFIPSSDMKDTRKRLLPKLFGTGGALCLWPPNEEIIKQKGADDEEDEGEDQEEGAGLQQHEKLEKQLRVRVARKACNYLCSSGRLPSRSKSSIGRTAPLPPSSRCRRRRPQKSSHRRSSSAGCQTRSPSSATLQCSTTRP